MMNFVNVGRLRANAPPSLANASTRARTTRDDARRDVRVAFDAFAIASRATIRDAREDEDERQNSPRPAVSSARSRDAMALDDDDDAIEDMLAHCDASAEYTYVDLSGRTQGPFDEIALARWHLADHLQRAHVVRRRELFRLRPGGRGLAHFSRVWAIVVWYRLPQLFVSLSCRGAARTNAQYFYVDLRAHSACDLVPEWRAGSHSARTRAGSANLEPHPHDANKNKSPLF